MMPRGETCRGLARAELLVIAGLAVILLSILLPSFLAVRHRARVRQVTNDFQLIIRGIDRFFNQYQTWPSQYMGTRRDVRYGLDLPNREVMNALRAVAGPGNAGHAVNPNRTPFLGLEGLPRGMDAEGEYRDPWGTPYQIVLDTDSDESCYVADSVYGLQPDQDLLVWSCGPDRVSDTGDDILAWRRRRPERQ